MPAAPALRSQIISFRNFLDPVSSVVKQHDPDSRSSRGHESLTIILRFARILVSALESYRFCPLIGLFISLRS